MKAYEILKENGVGFKYFKFAGSSYGRGDDFPCKVGEYNTVNYGWLSKYKLGNYYIGDWILVFESYTPGSPNSPSYYTAIYVKECDYLKAKEVLSEYGKKVTDFPVPTVEERKKELKEKILDNLDKLSLEELTKIVEVIEFDCSVELGI